MQKRAAILLLLAAACRPPEAKADPGAGPVLVELFTSEGCSSCPPADALLSKVASDRVIALSWHVDYWNDLGWRDPFSSAASTQRQREYARRLGGGLYTPELVVAGREAFVGSNEARARNALATAAFRQTRSTITASATRTGDRVTVGWRAGSAPARATLGVVLAETRVSVLVPRGENAGRRLEHAHVARAARFVPVATEGEAELVLPPGSGAGAAVVFVQDDSSFEVVAATRAPF